MRSHRLMTVHAYDTMTLFQTEALHLLGITSYSWSVLPTQMLQIKQPRQQHNMNRMWCSPNAVLSFMTTVMNQKISTLNLFKMMAVVFFAPSSCQRWTEREWSERERNRKTSSTLGIVGNRRQALAIDFRNMGRTPPGFPANVANWRAASGERHFLLLFLFCHGCLICNLLNRLTEHKHDTNTTLRYFFRRKTFFLPFCQSGL